MAKAKKSPKQNGAVKAPSIPTKVLPVTLLSGFLGSGKTTLLQHILRTEHGLRIAVIVNDIGAVNVDASLIRNTHRLTKTEEKVIALQNGCICCTLRGDLLEELVRLSELAEFDYVIVESSGISEPEQVAETFDARLAEQIGQMGEGPEGLDAATLETLRRLKDAGGLDKFARLDTTCTVIDAFTMFHDLETMDLLSARRDDVTPEDERTVSDLMVDQIEFADVIVLNKIDMVSKVDRSRVRELIKKLNHRCKIIETSFSKVDVKEIINTGMFNLELAQTGYGWLQDLHEMTLREVNGKKMVTPKPETEEYNVRNFVYTRRRPFNPRRLFALLHDKFILQHPQTDEDDDDDDDDDDEAMDIDDNSEEEDEDEDEEDPLEIPDPEIVLANKRKHPLFAKLFRSKGEFWLSTRPGRAGEWSQAGAMLTLSGGRPWFCTIPASEYETGNKSIDEMVRHDIQAGGRYGDRRQELVFIGEKLDVPGLEAALDACLLNDEEWNVWETVMAKGEGPNAQQAEKQEELMEVFDDGFPDWDDNEHEHEGEEEKDDSMDEDGHGAVKRTDSHHSHIHPHVKTTTKHAVRKSGIAH